MRSCDSFDDNASVASMESTFNDKQPAVTESIPPYADAESDDDFHYSDSFDDEDFDDDEDYFDDDEEFHGDGLLGCPCPECTGLF